MRGLEELQGVLRAVKPLQADFSGSNLRHQRLALFRIGGDQLFVFGERTIVLLPLLRRATEVQPGGDGYVLSAGIEKVFVILPREVVLARFQVQRAIPERSRMFERLACHPKLRDVRRSAYAEASADTPPFAAAQRRVVGGDGLEPPTLSV